MIDDSFLGLFEPQSALETLTFAKPQDVYQALHILSFDSINGLMMEPVEVAPHLGPGKY